MNSHRLKILFFGFIVFTAFSSVHAAVGWSDSPPFSVNLQYFPPTWVSWGYSDSNVFSVDLRLIRWGWQQWGIGESGSFVANLYPMRRTMADSDAFGYDYLANSQPGSGVRVPPPLDFYTGFVQFDGIQWVAPFSVPPDGAGVVVLTHGWNSQPEDMTPLAQAIKNRDTSIYIYGWRWGWGANEFSDANPNGKGMASDFAGLVNCTTKSYLLCIENALQAELAKTMQATFRHGRSLGDALFEFGVRPDRHYIHFIGHSFGGLVASEAAAVLTDRSGKKVQQVTTLDTPGIPGYANAVDYLKPLKAERYEVLYYDNSQTLILRGGAGYKANLPSSGLNFKLNPAAISGWPLHSVILDWYIQSTLSSEFDCNGRPYGFGWSAALHREPNWRTGLPTGNESETAISRGCMETTLELIGRQVNKMVDQLKVSFYSAASWAAQKARVVIDTAVKNSASSLLLTTSSVLNYSGMTVMSGQESTNNQTESDSDAYIFKTIQIPADANYMILDLRFTKVGQGDVLTVSIEQENVLVMDAATFGTSATYQQTPPAYIGNYAGQTVIVQIALRGTGAKDSEVLINAVRFAKLGLAADVDSSGTVNWLDLLRLADYWLAVGCAELENCDGADINRDGAVNLLDFVEFSDFWPGEAAQSADLNGDRVVNIADLLVLVNWWLTADCPVRQQCGGADLSGDGQVDLEDFAHFSDVWLMGY